MSRMGAPISDMTARGNLTGVASLNLEIAPKRVELLHEVVPTTGSIALLSTPPVPAMLSVNRQTRRLRPAHSGCSSTSCVQAPNAISIRSSRPWSKCDQSRS